MKLLSVKFVAVIFFIAIPFAFCKKELSCEACAESNNQPPTAVAGPDVVITLPVDTVLLDGSRSVDPDGSISAWQWTKIAGPSSVNMLTPETAKSSVRSLQMGVYQFELTITDNKGLSAKDTVWVTVDAPGNQPPVACAGADQVITLPVNTTTLDGTCSVDPENNITTYQWTKINGPAPFSLANVTAVKTDVSNLADGIYQFELKVTDAGGLTSKDTVQVIVGLANSTIACSDVNRPTINAHLVPIGKLSKARIDLAVAAAGTKVVFAGGIWTAECPECWGSPQVDIYDTVTKTWTTAKLSEGRWGITAVAAGNKIFFAGGEFGDGAFDTYFTNVDIYDVSTNSWSVVYLSETRSKVGATVLGDKVFFAGGESNKNYDCSNRVDIYNLSTKSWSAATLSEQRAFLSAVSVGDKAYFAGGTLENRFYARSNRIDIYDNSTNTWTISALKEHDGIVGGAVLHDNIYWSGGCPVEIRNAPTGISKQASLSRPGGNEPVVRNGQVIFISSGSRFDIYDPKTEKWSIGLLPRSVVLGGKVISVNNTIYLTDGDQVYKLEF